MDVANFDVAGAGDRLTRYAAELIGSQSHGSAEFNEHDRKRATEYLDRLIAYMKAVNVPDSPLDLPKTHPTAYPIKDFAANEQINAIENAEVRDLVRRLKAAYMELTGSQSKDRASGFLAADLERIEKVIANAREIIKLGEAVEDLPEQTGEAPVLPTGRS